MADLEQVQAALNSKRLEIISRAAPRRGPPKRGPPERGRAVHQTASRLDPAHKADPKWIEYRRAERALDAETKARGIRSRKAVTGPVREAFEKALSDWLAVRPGYVIPATGQAPQNGGASRPANQSSVPARTSNESVPISGAGP